MERLRDAALGALGMGDATARRALEQGRLVLDSTGDHWESSHGPVVGVKVTLLVDAETLGRIDAQPFTHGALERALATAFAERPLESMTELAVAWSRAGVATASYRDAPGREVAPRLEEVVVPALAAYVRGAGGPAALDAALSSASATREGGVVVVRVASRARRPADEGALAAAVARLVGGGAPRVRVVWG